MGVGGEILAHRSQLQQECEQEVVARMVLGSSGEAKGTYFDSIWIPILVQNGNLVSLCEGLFLSPYLLSLSQAHMFENVCFLKWPTFTEHSK